MASIVLSLFMLSVVLVLVGLQMRSSWDHFCGLRREFLMVEGIHQIIGAIAKQDHEASVGAVMEHFHKMQRELEWQNTHSWSVLRPFTMPDPPDMRPLLAEVAARKTRA